jgi:leishmanolysin
MFYIILLAGVLALRDMKCGYDTLEHTQIKLADPQLRLHHDRHLLDRADSTSSIRIHIEYGHLDLSPVLIAYLKTEVMPYAINWFTKTLKVNPIKGKLKLPYGYCYDALVSNYIITKGVDADVILFIYSNNYPTDDFIARAAACFIDPGFRNQPIAGVFEINSFYYDLTYTLEQHISLVIHELSHILGFDPELYPLFTKADGTAYTAGEISGTTVRRGKVVTEIILPKVVDEARTAFQCATLTGVELEDEGGPGTVGAHWEKRILFNEYMTGSISPSEKVYSRMTLALFESTGWYEVDYSHSNDILWGAGQGCDFLNRRCVINGKAQFAEFCDKLESKCSYNHMHGGYCSITNYDTPFSPYYQYFSSPFLGGDDSLADYCPYARRYANRNCRGLNYTPNIVLEEYGEEVCLDCRCVEGTFLKDGYVSNNSLHASCIRVLSCDDTKAILKIGDSTVDCPFTGGTVTVPGFQGTLTCPHSDVLCRKQCANFCNGAGLCQTDGSCICDAGFFGVDCHNLCNSNCLACSDALTCTSCSSPNAEIVNGVCHCKTGYIATPDVNNCASVEACPTTQKRYGAECITDCPADFTVEIADVCYPCDVTCAACSGTVSSCTACAAPKLLYLGTCVLSCPSGFFNDDTECLACEASCLSCSSSASHCVRCAAGKFLSGSVCVDVCPDSTYAASSICAPCDTSCLTCSGLSTSCLSCPGVNLLSGTSCVDTCPSGQTPSNGVCGCLGNCMTCSTTQSTCTSCKSSTYLYDTTCLDVCPDGYTALGEVCTKCHMSCLTCTGLGPEDCTS